SNALPALLPFTPFLRGLFASSESFEEDRKSTAQILSLPRWHLRPFARLRRLSREFSGKVPSMAFGIFRSVTARAVWRIRGLFDDHGSRFSGALAMPVHIFDIDVEVLCDVAKPLRVF